MTGAGAGGPPHVKVFGGGVYVAGNAAVQAVPEPTSAALVSLAGALLALGRAARRRAGGRGA